MLTHLEDRHLTLSLYPTSLVVSEKEATFLLYDLSGRLNGYQVYNPSNLKKADNPREAKYFSWLTKYHSGVWGLEYPLESPVFIVEGVFDAARLHTLGYSAIAVLANNPTHLNGWLRCLPYDTVSLCDGDKAGRKLDSVAKHVEYLPEGTDVSDIPIEQLINILEKYK